MSATISRMDPDALIRRAEADAQLSNWGDAPFLDALEVLCRSVREDQPRRPNDVVAFEANILRFMNIRLRMMADRAAYPEIAAQKIEQPLIVMGLPRSGTTILHSLLSQDPRLRSPQRWEVDEPSPPPRTETYSTDPRIERAARAVEEIDPVFRAMHQMGATLPEECNHLQSGSFRSLNFWARLALPTYSRWLLDEANMRPAFDYHRQFLQHLQAYAPRDRWVLKSPPYLFWPKDLLLAYPDACIVMTHRDPAEVLPSNASLVAHIRGSDGPENAKGVGAEQMIWLRGVERTMAYRAREARKGQFIDVQYRDFLANPIETIRTIYAYFNIEMTQDVEAAMRAFMVENRQGKHGEHNYTAEKFGLEADIMHSRFASYIDHYNIPVRK